VKAQVPEGEGTPTRPLPNEAAAGVPTGSVNQQGANAIIQEGGAPNGIQNVETLTQELTQLEQTITEGEGDVKAAGKFDQAIDGGEAAQ